MPVITALKGTPLLLLSISQSEEKIEGRADGKVRSYFYVNQSEIKSTEIPWKNFAMPVDKVQSLIQEGEQLFLLSNKKSASGEILKMDLSTAGDKLQLSQFKELVKASATEIKHIAVSKSHLFWHTLAADDSISKLFKLDLINGARAELTLPESGVLTQLHVDHDTELLSFNLKTANASAGAYTMTPQGKNTVVTAAVPMQSEVVKERNPVERRSLLISAADGRNLSVDLSYLSGFEKNAGHPVLLRIAPGTDVATEFGDMAWLEKGGVIANLNINVAGTQSAKVVDAVSDIATVARYLVKENYASPKKLVAEEMQAGNSALVKAMLRQPDLFAAVAAHAVTSEELPKAPGLIKPKINTPRTAYAELRADVAYPAVLLTADAKNTQAPIWMAAKLAAGLQILSTNKNKPVLLQTMAQSTTTEDALTQKANRWAFFLWQTGVQEFSFKTQKISTR